MDYDEYLRWEEIRKWISDTIGDDWETLSDSISRWYSTADLTTKLQIYSLKAITLGIKQLVDQGNANTECLKEIRDAVNRSRR
jgi:hypothetical protein